MKKVAVLGSGAWGTAIATVLAHNGHTVHLWAYEEEVVDTIKKESVNRLYLPDVKLNKNIIPTTKAAEALEGVEWIFEAVPVKYMRQVLQTVKPHYKESQRWIVLSKGIEQHTLLLPTQVLDDVFGKKVTSAALVGPSFAHDVAAKQLTGIMIASSNAQLKADALVLVQNSYMVLFPSTDLVGVQLCAALKNVITVGVGILEGAGYSDTTKTFFLMRALQEMRSLVVGCGGKADTVDGLAGIGDVILTALGKHSKNLSAGRKLGSGQTAKQLFSGTHVMPEGFNTLESVGQLIEKNNLHLPLLKSLGLVVKGEKNLNKLLELLAQQ